MYRDSELRYLAALIVHRVQTDLEANLAHVLEMASHAAEAGASLILLPEAALTGLRNNDDPAHDLPLGQEIPGPVTAVLASFCRRHSVWLGIGLLEREGNQLFDSAILLDSSGRIALKYRRNQPNWHGQEADPSVYRQGSDIGKVDTPFGSVSFLICGDLFDDAIVNHLKDLNPDWLLFPFARCFPPGSEVRQRWETEEVYEYLKRIRQANIPALMVNYLGDNLPEDNSFGGAFAVSAEGEVVASLPLLEEGTLLVARRV